MLRNNKFLSNVKINKFNFLKNKKADIQISLSWLFMIIIGSFFLYIAYSIIGTYSENEETKYRIEVKSALSNVLIKAGQTIGYEENYIQPIDTFFKDSRVQIICNQGIPLLQINDDIDENIDFLKSIPTFMTVIEEGTVSFTYLAVENFRTPFKVTNMMAIVSDKNMIVFDSNSDITEVLEEKFSESSYRDSLSISNKDFSSIDASTYNSIFKDKEISSIMFVSDESVNLGLNLSDLNIDSYHLKVSGSGSEFKHGELMYIDKYNVQSNYSYIDFRDDIFESKPLASVTMAIFSSPETYGCGQDLIIESTQAIFEYYINKAEYLEKISEDFQVCSNDLVYGDIDAGTFDGSFQIEKYSDLKSKLIIGKNEIENNRFNNSETIYNIMSEIQELSQSLSDDSCEMIY